MPAPVRRFGDVLSPVQPSRRSSSELHRIEQASGVEQVRLQHRQLLAEMKLEVVAGVGIRAMQTQVLVTQAERLLVEMEPGAIGSISFFAQRTALGLGQVLDSTIAEICR